MLITVLGLVIAAGVGAYIFVPYFFDWDKEDKGSYLVLEDSREALMTQLAELEYDFRSGKLLEADYKTLRLELELRLLASQEERGEQTSSGP